VSAWPLLQGSYKFLPTPQTSAIIYVLITIGVIAVLLVVGGILSYRRTHYLDPEQRQRFRRTEFQRMARNIGLGRQHTEYLEYLIRVCKVQQPFMVFTNAGLLDDILRKGIAFLHQSASINPEERERRMAFLFQIKQIIERNAKRGIGINSSHFLKVGQGLVISPEGGGQFQSRVMSNLRDMLALSAPKSEAGSAIRWQRGTRLTLSFWREGDAGYTFQSKILAYDSIKGQPCLLVQHSRTLRRAQQRRFRRTALNRPCFFYAVHIVEEQQGRKTVRRAMIQTNRRVLGYVQDISAGGCAISTLSPLPAGSLCKAEFEIAHQNRIVVFGKIKRVRGLGHRRGGIMHLMFTTLSSRHLNQIYSYVYGYAPKTPGPAPTAYRGPGLTRGFTPTRGPAPTRGPFPPTR
jgi:c-di-GMP-binding flagellar brake protein YcgR